MHHHRNAEAALAHRRASTSPQAGVVEGLGLVDAVRTYVDTAQLPWLAAEVDIVRYCLEDELAHQRKRYEQLPSQAIERGWPQAREAEQELGRREYQLQALAMIRDQLPISSEAARVATASPWDAPAEDTGNELDRDTPPVAVVGPAALMTILICGATRHAAGALTEALRGAGLDVDHYTDSTGGWRGRELPRVSSVVADRIRATARAAHAFTDAYLDVLAYQNYRFDPQYDPRHADAT